MPLQYLPSLCCIIFSLSALMFNFFLIRRWELISRRGCVATSMPCTTSCKRRRRPCCTSWGGISRSWSTAWNTNLRPCIQQLENWSRLWVRSKQLLAPQATCHWWRWKSHVYYWFWCNSTVTCQPCWQKQIDKHYLSLFLFDCFFPWFLFTQTTADNAKVRYCNAQFTHCTQFAVLHQQDYWTIDQMCCNANKLYSLCPPLAARIKSQVSGN